MSNVSEVKKSYGRYYSPEISDLLNRVFTKVYQDGDAIVFENNVEVFRFEHQQDCCEHVYIESIVGDLQDLVGTPILKAEEVSYDGGELAGSDDSYSWTFYKFATIKGYVDARWYGSSNGYYSEDVDLDYRKIEQ